MRVFSEMPEVLQNALPDTLVWLDPLAYNDPYVEYYLRHPAYNEYPVVGVSWNKARGYALWRTDRVNEMILIDEGILLSDPAGCISGRTIYRACWRKPPKPETYQSK
jgi:hypothetical protein